MAVTEQDRRRTLLTRSIGPRTDQNQALTNHDGVFRRRDQKKGTPSHLVDSTPGESPRLPTDSHTLPS